MNKTIEEKYELLLVEYKKVLKALEYCQDVMNNMENLIFDFNNSISNFSPRMEKDISRIFDIVEAQKMFIASTIVDDMKGSKNE
jgi:predicted  nucleic acid-binding Zn-ribbon protein